MGIFNELLSTQIVNVARFARNVERDFFCDFQILCLGSAILAKAASSGSSLEDALKAMQGSYHVFQPNPSTKTYHGQKFAVFQELLQSQLRCRQLMK